MKTAKELQVEFHSLLGEYGMTEETFEELKFLDEERCLAELRVLRENSQCQSLSKERLPLTIS